MPSARAQKSGRRTLPARRENAGGTGARTSLTFSPSTGASHTPIPATPASQSGFASSQTRHDTGLLQSLSGLTGATVVLSTKTGQRLEGIVASTSGQGNTTGVALKDVKDITNPGAPLKNYHFIALTNIESWTSGPADSISSNGNLLERKAPRIANEIHGTATTNHLVENTGHIAEDADSNQEKFVLRARKQAAMGSTTAISGPKAEASKIAVNGPDGAQIPTPPSKTSTPAPAATSQVPTNMHPADPLPAFNDFVVNEEYRLTQGRQELARLEMEWEILKLMKFSESLKLNMPIPEDILPILTKDEEKQRAIREKTTLDAQSSQARSAIGRVPPNVKPDASRKLAAVAKTNKVDKSIQTADVSVKVYADADIQAQLDPQLRSNSSALSSLLTILRKKKPESPISCVINVTTIDLARSLLTMKNYVNTALQLTGEPDTELLLDFMLYLLCGGHLPCSEAPDAHRRARRLMLKMVTKTPVTPRSLFVKGIDAKVDYDYIGRGGFGFVFKGELRGAAVALKQLYKTRRHDDFCREALLWRSLNHERVLPFLGIFEDEAASRIFLVSPYMENGTLCQWRKKTGPSTLEIQRLILEVAEGLQYIHSEGIVHGDLRGDNILLDSDFHAQIADFGLTRHSEATATQSGALHHNFAAPELFGNWVEGEDVSSESDDDGQSTARTQKSDVYAFGCLYYEIQFDSIPFQGMNEIQIVKHVSRGKRPPRLDEPLLSDQAWKLIKRCWAREAARRPAMEDIMEKMMTWRSV